MAKAQKQPIKQPAAAAPRAAATPRAENKSTGKGFSMHTKLALLLGVLAFLLYANTIKNKFALDDFTVIRDNSIVSKGVSAIPEVFATPYRRGWFITTNDLYRPLSLAMFATEWTVFDKEPGGMHLMNILVFAGCVIFLFLFLDAFFERKRTAVAFIAALLFALHPIHTEVVANIKSRDELLCFFFAFLSLNIYMKYMDTGKMQQLVLGALCFLLSFFSKETVVTMVVIIPVIFFFYHNKDKSRAGLISLSAGAMAVIFLAVRYAVLSKYNANSTSEVSFMDNFLTIPPSAASRLATEILILGDYIKLLFVPYPLICDYSYNSIPFVTFGNIWVILSLLFYAGLAVYAIMRFLKDKRDPYAFAIFFFLVTISLFSNILLTIGSPMAERFVFFASVGFCLVVALVIDRFLAAPAATAVASLSNTKVLAIIIPVCLVYAAISFNRNKDWYDNETLFTADVEKAPNDSRLTYYMGTELVATKSKEMESKAAKDTVIRHAINFLRKSIDIYPQYTDAQASLGDAYFNIAAPGSPDLDSAEVHGRKALEINPKYALAINNLAGVYFVKTNYLKAMDMCKQAIAINPNYINAYSNMGLCYLRLGKFDSSLTVLYKSMSLDPNFTGTYENIILTYKALGKQDSVAKYTAILKQLHTAG